MVEHVWIKMADSTVTALPSGWEMYATEVCFLLTYPYFLWRKMCAIYQS